MPEIARQPSLIHFLHYVALQDFEPNGQPVEVLWCAPGDDGTNFRIRHIGELLVTEGMLEQIAGNFERLDKSPQRLGLHVNHNTDGGLEDRAIGWVTDMALVRTDERVSLEFTPHWCEEARAVIEDGGFRFVSIGLELDSVHAETGEHVGPRAREISICSVPAISSLRPIELSSHVPLDQDAKTELAALEMTTGPNGETDMLDQARAIAEAFYGQHPDSEVSEYWIAAVYFEARSLIVNEIVRRVDQDGASTLERSWQLSFLMANEGAVAFAAREDWQEVEQRFVPVAAEAAVQDPTSEMDAAEPVAAIPTRQEADTPAAGGADQAELTEETTMDEHLSQIRDMLGLDAEATAEEIVAAAQEAVTSRAALQGEADERSNQATADQEALSAKDRQIVALSEQATTEATERGTLAARVETLETEKNVRESEAAITAALSTGKLTGAEVANDDSPMRVLALTNRPLFDQLVAARPDSTLTVELSNAGDPEQTSVNSDEFWALVATKKEADPALAHVTAQDQVLEDHPEYKELFETATAKVHADRS